MREVEWSEAVAELREVKIKRDEALARVEDLKRQVEDRVAGMTALDELWRLRAERLYQLLDDIDTLDDAAKGDEEAYRRGVRRLHRKRFQYATSDGYDLTWLPLEDRHEETAGETMARVLNSMRPESEESDGGKGQ